MSGSDPSLLEWEDVLPAAQAAFSVWKHGRDLEWARVAWEHLAAAGLTAYRSEVELCRVCVRLLVLAQLYFDWCALADDEEQEDELSWWWSELDQPVFRLGQLVGERTDLEGDDDTELVDSALALLTGRGRRGVVNALLAGFGGSSSLFLSLWRINHPAPPPAPPAESSPSAESSPPAKSPPSVAATPHLFSDRLFADETPSLFSEEAGEEKAVGEEDDEAEEEEEEDYYAEEDEDDMDGEDDFAVLNHVTGRKMAAFEWIEDGCPSVRE